jgi:hypothetical protein
MNNIDALFTDAGLRAFTDAQRDQHMTDASQYAQLADVIKRRLEQTPIDGDKPFSARRRARKVARKMKRMERASRKAAASSEALYAAYVNHVLELPERRQLAADRKAARQGRRQVTAGAGDRVAKSLHKSAQTFGPAPVTGVSQQSGAAPQYLPPKPFPYPMAAGAEHQEPRTIADFIPKEGR